MIINWQNKYSLGGINTFGMIGNWIASYSVTVDVQYPLAGIPISYPLAGVDVQYPLAGIERTYP